MDVWVEFKNASKWQCEALFRNFFPSSEDFFATSSSVPNEVEVDEDAFELPGLTCSPMNSSPSTSSVPSSTTGSSDASSETMNENVTPAFPPPSPQRKSRTNAALDPAMLARLAKTFAEAIPEGEFSVAALQGCESH